MLTQLLGWAATAVGFWSTWLCGKHHRSGWLHGVACCGGWVAVNARLGLWAGVVSGIVAAALAARNWWAWRPAAVTHTQPPPTNHPEE